MKLLIKMDPIMTYGNGPQEKGKENIIFTIQLLELSLTLEGFFRGPLALMKRDEYNLDENSFGTFYETGPDPYSNYRDMFGKRFSHPVFGKRGPEHMWRSKDSESDHSKNDAPFIYLDIPLDLPMMGF